MSIIHSNLVILITCEIDGKKRRGEKGTEGGREGGRGESMKGREERSKREIRQRGEGRGACIVDVLHDCIILCLYFFVLVLISKQATNWMCQACALTSRKT